MPATVSGKLVTIVGADIGEIGSAVFALCGYGSFVPIVSGAAIIGRLTALEVEADQNGLVTALLWGNDLIWPAQTYYTVTIKDSNGDIQQIGAYRFLEGQSYDLGTVTPIDPTLPPPLPPPPPAGDDLIEVPSSPNPDFDGSQATAWRFYLTEDVTAATISGCIPGNLYTFIITQDGTGNHVFTWPPGVNNAAPINTDASVSSIQTFLAIEDGSLFAIAPGTYTPE